MEVKQVPAHPQNYTKHKYPKYGVVIHWMVGTLEGTDRWFQNSSARASAHYGIGKTGEIHQYVQDEYYAWHAGNTQANRDYIGIELEGGYLKDGQRVNPTFEAYEACASLMKALRDRYGWVKFKHNKNVFRHKEVSNTATQCCGTTDIATIIKLANEEPKEDLPSFVKWNNDIKEKGYIPVGQGIINTPDSIEEMHILEWFHNGTLLIQNGEFNTNGRIIEALKKYITYLENSPFVNIDKT